ncbi:unnamed protein product [Prunus armeniaca]
MAAMAFGTENGVTGFNWKDWVEDVNFECVENIVADFCVPRNEEEAYSAPNVHPHRESNFQASMVQVTQVQYENPQQSSWTQMHTSQVHLVHGKSVEDIDYGGGLSCINWEANFKVGRYNLGNVGCVFVVGNFLALGDFGHIKLDYMSLGLLNTIHFMNVI